MDDKTDSEKYVEYYIDDTTPPIPVDELSDRELLLYVIARTEKMRESVNGSVAVLNWIRENVQGLFTTIQQMNAAGGPAALIGAMMGNRNG